MKEPKGARVGGACEPDRGRSLVCDAEIVSLQPLKGAIHCRTQDLGQGGGPPESGVDALFLKSLCGKGGACQRSAVKISQGMVVRTGLLNLLLRSG